MDIPRPPARLPPARDHHPWAFRFEIHRIAGGRTRRERALLDRQAAARLILAD